jgi:hypothetical protein
MPALAQFCANHTKKGRREAGLSVDSISDDQ